MEIVDKFKQITVWKSDGKRAPHEPLLREIRPRQRQSYFPGTDYVKWHVREVFKGYAREG